MNYLDTIVDHLVDLGAIAGLSYVAVEGALSEATLQVVGGMIVSIAIGKRYLQTPESNT